ncbi:MAG: FKBP-type peptidyl-prolyl cis-trans isomerase [Gemmatimonadetes bacterium]|nr:MAG: FKBP-type peptidyl-prolyl cis-trans isomerase [Gemmatimonadota bacterium]
MRTPLAALAAAALVTLAACDSGRSAPPLDTDDRMASYSYGLDIGNSLKPTGEHLDLDALMKGVEDALAGAEPAVDRAMLQAARGRVAELIQQEQEAARAEAATKNAEEGAAYLAENGAREGVTTTASGLQYEVLEAGEADGPHPGPEDRVRIHYRGTLIDGSEFDSSYGRGQPAEFGVGGVIAGFAEGLQLMTPGSKYRFVIPAELAYGAQGAGDVIGPNATLIFEVELLEIL